MTVNSKTYNKDVWNNSIERVSWIVNWQPKTCECCGTTFPVKAETFVTLKEAYDFIAERQQKKDYGWYTDPCKVEV